MLENIDFILTLSLKFFALITLIGTSFLVIYLILIVQSVQERLHSIEELINYEIQKVQYESEIMKKEITQKIDIARLHGTRLLISLVRKLF